jgi:hypothetical protein
VSFGLGAETAGGRAGLVEVTAKSGHQERSEDEFGAPMVWLDNNVRVSMGSNQYVLECRQRKPKQEHKLEGEVEGEPVHDANQALNDARAGSALAGGGL